MPIAARAARRGRLPDRACPRGRGAGGGRRRPSDTQKLKSEKKTRTKPACPEMTWPTS